MNSISRAVLAPRSQSLDAPASIILNPCEICAHIAGCHIVCLKLFRARARWRRCSSKLGEMVFNQKRTSKTNQSMLIKSMIGRRASCCGFHNEQHAQTQTLESDAAPRNRSIFGHSLHWCCGSRCFLANRCGPLYITYTRNILLLGRHYPRSTHTRRGIWRNSAADGLQQSGSWSLAEKNTILCGRVDIDKLVGFVNNTARKVITFCAHHA